LPSTPDPQQTAATSPTPDPRQTAAPDPDALLVAALQYAAHGWPIFPCRPRGKEPLTAHGFHDATTDLDQIAAWWAETPDANIGLATGAVSGVDVIDLDAPDALPSELVHLVGRTPTVRTARGQHLFCAHRDGVRCRTAVWPHVDVRGDGGYVILPPSTHPSGAGYEHTIPPFNGVAFHEMPDLPERRADPPARTVPTESPWAATALAGELERVRGATKGTRNAALNRAAHALGQIVAGGSLDADTVRGSLADAASAVGLGAAEAARTIASGLAAGARDPRRPIATRTDPVGEHPATQPTDPPGDWTAMLLTSSKGPRSCVANAMTALRHAPELRGIVAWDELYGRPTVQSTTPWGAQAGAPWRDVDDTYLAEWLQGCGIYCGPDMAHTAVEAVAHEHRHHPIREYLAGLEWDGMGRLDMWLSAYMGATATPYTASIGAWWLISAVARVMRPGCKADHMIVLEGPQGRGKSSVLEALAQPWFADRLPDVRSKDAILALSGVWVLELAELESLTRSEVEPVKAFLSCRTDHYRPPYGRAVIDVPRQCVLAGSTNSQAYLLDATGGRRFWPVECGDLHPDAMERERDQLWAEAAHAYHEGAAWWPRGAEVDTCAEEQEARRKADPWEPVIASYMLSHDDVAIGEILAHLEVETGRQTPRDAARACAILTLQGCRQTRPRAGGPGRPRRWVRGTVGTTRVPEENR